MPGGFLWSRPACNQSVTEGAWGPAVNWVKAPRDISANMTQYRVNARNCEAKRLHTGPYVACECAHVCLARHRFVQSAPRARRQKRAPACDAGRRAAPCPHTLGSGGPTMANCGRIPMSAESTWPMGPVVSFGQ